MLTFFEISSGTDAYKIIYDFIWQLPDSKEPNSRSIGDFENALGLTFFLDLDLFENKNYYIAALSSKHVGPLSPHNDLKTICFDEFKEKLGTDFTSWDFVTSSEFHNFLLSKIN